MRQDSKMLIKSNCIDARNREEFRLKKDARRQEDIRNGLVKINTGPQRGDYKICKEGDKILKDYRSFNSPKDREKIAREYFEMQKSYRRKNG